MNRTALFASIPVSELAESVCTIELASPDECARSGGIGNP